MSYEGLGSLVAEIRQASDNIAEGDARTDKRFEVIEKSVNELYLLHQRPGREGGGKDASLNARMRASCAF